MFDVANQQTGFNTPTVNQQDNGLLGLQPTSNPLMTGGQGINPENFNTTAFQSNPAVANMVKALKGTP